MSAMKPRIALIAALAENGVIGRDNTLPWRLADDLRYFKERTLGKPVVMGRHTYDSIGRALPGRPNIVVSRDPDFAPAGVQVFADLEEALQRGLELAHEAGVDELMVIGGAQIYAATLPRAARLYLTEVHARIEGDTWFPPLDRAAWREVSRDARPRREGDSERYSFVIYERAREGDAG